MAGGPGAAITTLRALCAWLVLPLFRAVVEPGWIVLAVLPRASLAGSAAVLIDEPVGALDAASLGHLQRVLLRCAADAARAWGVTSHEPFGPAGARRSCLDLRDPHAS